MRYTRLYDDTLRFHPMTVLGDLRGKLLIGFGVGVAVVLALIVVGDARQLWRTLETFRWEFIPLILGLTVLNYALRFVKWHYYLGLIGAAGVGLRASLSIFLSGLTMAMTPGKVGELLKSVLLRRATGTPLSVSAPIVMAERLTDGVALLFLSAGGLVLYRVGAPVLALIGVLAVLVVVVRNGVRADLVLGGARRAPFVRSRTEHVAALYDSSRNLLRCAHWPSAWGSG
ncbi:MAG: lysylphosphatidylglycerol synthase transmembrane domain-containing protein [Chloroflexia bacterium]